MSIPDYLVDDIDDALACRGVEMLDVDGQFLQCRECMEVWSPELEPDGITSPEYWECPNGCNARYERVGDASRRSD